MRFKAGDIVVVTRPASPRFNQPGAEVGSIGVFVRYNLFNDSMVVIRIGWTEYALMATEISLAEINTERGKRRREW